MGPLRGGGALLTEGWELAAREAIRDTLARYAHAVDMAQADELADLFTVDGVLEVDGGPRWEGREAIRAVVGDAVERPTRMHHVSNVVVRELTPTRARVEAYVAVYTGRGVDHWGRYADELVCEEGRWRFARRLARVDGRAPR